MRFLTWAAFTVGVFCVLSGLLSLLPAEGAVSVEMVADQVTFTAGEEHTIHLRVASGGRALRVLNITPGCTPDCCFRAKHPDSLPLTVPAGTAVLVPVLVIPHEGAFDARLEASIDDGRLKTFAFSLSGIAVKP